MLPDFAAGGSLPPGVHSATWEEFTERFGRNRWRRHLLDGLLRAMQVLHSAGCTRVYVNGSFITSKSMPGDFDVAWEPTNVDVDLLLKLEPVFAIFDEGRAAQKTKFHGEFFPSSMNEGLTGRTFLDFFQIDKEGAPKGIVALELDGRQHD